MIRPFTGLYHTLSGNIRRQYPINHHHHYLPYAKFCTQTEADLQGEKYNQLRKEPRFWSACYSDAYLIKFYLADLNMFDHRKMLFFDVGANKGYTITKWLSLWMPHLGINGIILEEFLRQKLKLKDCAIEIHAFEPQPSTYQVLTKLKRWMNTPFLHIHKVAVSNQSEIRSLRKCLAGFEQCALETTSNLSNTKYYTNTIVTTLDKFVDERNISQKIDTERFDSLVIQGCGEYLQTILVQPKSVEIPLGETVILDCTAFNQYGEVAWCKDGHCTMGRERPLYFIPRYEVIGDKQAGINSLKIRDINLDDDGIYQCQIGRTIEAREVLSNFANLTVLIPPNQISLTYVPPGIAISGKEFKLKCEILNARPSATFTWKTPTNTHIVNISQINEPMTTNSKLLKSISIITLVADMSQHGQEITCEAAHVALNKSLTSTAIIAIDYQPVVKIVLKPTKMYEDKDYWFECTAESRPSITELVWKTNDTILQRISPMPDGRYPLHLTVTRQMHNQHLSCSALNSAGIAEDVIVLNISYSPIFKSFPSPYTLARMSDPLILSCNVDSNPPANILWTKNGEFVGGGSQYQIPEVHENDYAVYACIATVGGQFTKIVASTKVVAPGPPRFYPPQPVLASRGSEVMLKCQLEKHIELTNSFWIFKNITLINNMKYTVVPARDVKAIPRYEMGLIIHNVQKNDFGEYECHAANQYGTEYARLRLEKRSSHLLMQIAIYFTLLVLLSLILFSSYLCWHYAFQVDQKRTTLGRIRRVQTWLQSKPSMWIHNLPAAEKIPLTVYDVNSGVTRTTLDPPVDIIECYVTMMDEQKRQNFNRPLLPPPPPPPILIDRMPFCNDDQSEQIYETADPMSWHIDV
ncbi:unnamed protein product [Rotaria magnacalcarata]